MMSCLSPQMPAQSVLVEVVARADDYEHRFVGADMTEAFQSDFTGKRLSALVRGLSQDSGSSLRMVYEMVRASGEPLGYRGWVGNDLPRADFVYHESVILPLGEAGVVDHLLAITAPGAPRPRRGGLSSNKGHGPLCGAGHPGAPARSWPLNGPGQSLAATPSRDGP